MIRILIVHKIPLVSHVLAHTLADEPDLQIVAEAVDLTEALVLLRSIPCDLMLLNAEHLDRQTLHFIREATEQERNLKILITGLAGTPELILQCLQTGAAGYMPEDTSLADLRRQIRAVNQGQAVLSPEITYALVLRLAELNRVVTQLVVGEQDRSRLYGQNLTPREREILGYLERGYTNRQIADLLVVEEGTVKNHIHHILCKLKVDNRKQAAQLAHLLTIHRYETVRCSVERTERRS